MSIFILSAFNQMNFTLQYILKQKRNLMKKSFIQFLVISAMVLFTSCAAKGPSVITPSDPNISYIGRVSFTNPESPCFTYPGVQIKAAFTGTSLSLKMKPNSGYFMVGIDEQEPFKIAILENDSIIALASDLKDTIHNICITCVYEAYNRRPEFRGFILDPGKKLATAPALSERKMEFIGNSITCGYGVEVLDPNAHFSDETENHYYTYAAITARAFGAQSMVVSRSGIGIYRNYGDKIEGSRGCMPNMYHQTLFNDNSENWDFTKYTPNVVCINLGTNDTSLNKYDLSKIENGYRDFLKTLRGNYPEAKIVFLTGSMMNGKALEDVKKALNTVVEEAKASGDNEVYRFDLTPQDGSLGYGADWHPSKAQHEKGASELIPFIESITGWSKL